MHKKKETAYEKRESKIINRIKRDSTTLARMQAGEVRRMKAHRKKRY
jgi:hypothetical protein